MRQSRPVIITRHAVDRFVERHAPHLTTRQAFLHLLEAVPRAAHLKAKTLLGHAQWQLQDPECVLVIRESRGRNVCVTVLPEPEQVEDPTLLEARRLKRRGRRDW